MAGTQSDPIDLTAAGEEAGPVKQAAAEKPQFGARHPPVKPPRATEGRKRVHELVQRFHLDPASVDALLKSTKDILAGGAMLHAYMGLPPGDFDADLDVFAGEESLPRWRQLLQEAGYAYRPFKPRPETVQRTDPGELLECRALNEAMEASDYPPGVNGIVQVLDFVRAADGRKVQIIVCLVPEKMPEGFDLSAAATYYNGRTLETLFPWITRRWLTFWMAQEFPVGPSHRRERLLKYQGKGFTLLEDGKPYIKVPDDPRSFYHDYEGMDD